MNAGSGDTPPHGDGLRDRRLLFAVLAAAYLTGLVMRLLELPQWSNPLLSVDGEPLMATHDAYAWLAGARGVGTGADSLMSGLVSLIASLCGTPLGHVAFWIPALAGPLVGVATGLWAWTLGSTTAALGAGMLASLAPGFLYRSRLGFYDTDIVTLLFPLLQTWLLGQWLHPWLRHPLCPSAAPPRQGEPRALAPLLAGLAMRYGGAAWHPMLLHFATGTVVLGTVLAMVLARPGSRPRLLSGLAVCALAAFGSWPGLAAALALTAALHLRLERKLPAQLRTLVTGAALALALGLVLAPQIQSAAIHLRALGTSYTHSRVELRQDDRPKEETSTAIYPGIIQSVIEARSMDLANLSKKLSGWPVGTWLGLTGFLVVLALRPVALLLAPLVVVTFLSGSLGARMSMFGGPEVALGLALPLSWAVARLLRRRHQHRALLLAAQALLALVMLLPLYSEYSTLRPSPVLAKQHALALKAVGRIAPADAAVWTWWDWGYAAQYYSGLKTFADGARHSGEYLYPLALTLTTPVPLQARQMMQYAALKGYKPWEIFDKRSAPEVREFIASMTTNRYDLDEAPPQYLVVTWENLRLAHWITYYGTWDLAKAQGMHGQHVLLGDFTLDQESGEVTQANNPSLLLKSLDVLSANTLSRKNYPREKGARLLVHQLIGQSALLDDISYNGMNYRLLTCDPSDPEISKEFKLVYEGFPLLRIWQAK